MINNDDEKSKVISYKYIFTLGDKNSREFTVNLDKSSLKIILPERKSFPDWTKLNYHKCPNCFLEINDFLYCPAAMSLIDIIEFFKDFSSIEKADITIETDSRTYFKHTTLSQCVFRNLPA